MLQLDKCKLETEMFCHSFAAENRKGQWNWATVWNNVESFTFNKYDRSISVNGTNTSLNLINFKCFSKNSPLKRRDQINFNLESVGKLKNALLGNTNFSKSSSSGYFRSNTDSVFSLLWLTYPVIPKSLIKLKLRIESL